MMSVRLPHKLEYTGGVSSQCFLISVKVSLLNLCEGYRKQGLLSPAESPGTADSTH